MAGMISVGDFFGSNYRRQIASKEWKAFEDRIRAGRQNACEHCKRCDIQTEVHHINYEPERKAWEYEPSECILLCRHCHRAMHDRLQEFRRHVFKYLRHDSMRVLNGALLVGLSQHDPMEFAYAVAEMASSPSSVKRFFKAWVDEAKPVQRKPAPRKKELVKKLHMAV